ncbi:ABC transporter permease [bacterium 1XD8-76]|nr:ABC transporter permease [bacterium 1XD8-76]
MKSYLSLIPISAKVHRKKNKMTRLCIFLAVFLVTGIFSMADMEVRSQKIRAVAEYGNWHIMLKNITEEEAGMIAMRPEVAASSWYNSLNYRLREEYMIGGKKVGICGIEESLVTEILAEELVEGVFPGEKQETLLLDNAKDSLGVETGDTVLLEAPSGEKRAYRVSGFLETEAMAAKLDAVVMCLPIGPFQELYRQEKQEDITDVDMVYYVKFKDHIDFRRAIDRIKAEYGLEEEDVSENTMLLAVAGASRDSTFVAIYGAAVVLFFLVLLAGTLMIASSLNSNIAQRTAFFGMLHCIGADRKQTIRFVRLEALYWCRTAVPAGVSAGVVMTWLMCSLLRFLSAEYFADMPVFGVSIAGIVMGAAAGLLTVLIAAGSPAKKAAKVSPLTAVSGNAWNTRPLKKAANTKRTKIDTALGVYHARQNRRNFLLMTGSFAVSIILFLGFSSLWDFMGYAITPLRPYTPDFSILSKDETCSVPKELVQELYQTEGVKRVYGRQFAYDITAHSESGDRKVMLISYEALQFNWADEEKWASDRIGLEKTAKDAGEGSVLAVYSQNCPWQQGDMIRTDLGELTVEGFLEHCPFSGGADTEILVCSEALFARLTGQTAYTIIDIQVRRGAGEKTTDRLRELAGDQFLFSDNRLSDKSARGAYYSFAVFLYGFLGIIAVIAAFNIINSISMSVAARLKQYGAMRAVGMDMRQIGRMLRAETCTYAGAGIVAGTLFGLPVHRYLWNHLIYPRWNAAWEIPAAELCLVVLLVAVSSAIAVRGPMKRIENMNIVDVIADY